MVRYILTLFITFSVSSSVFSQPAFQTCNNFYYSIDTLCEYKPVDIVFDKPPYVYITLLKKNVISGLSETYSIKVDAQNSTGVWVRSLYNTTPAKIITNGSSVFVAATSNYQPPTSRDLYVQKYLSNGNPAGQYSYVGTGGDYVRSMCIDNAGGLYLTGRTDSLNKQQIITIKLDTNMALVWEKIYTPPSQYTFNEGEDIVADASGNVYVTGFISYDQAQYSTYNYITLKYNSSGVLQWAVTYDGAMHTEDKAIAISLHNINGNGVVVTGYSTETPNYNVTTIKYLQDSTIQFVNHFGGLSRVLPKSMTTDPAGNIYVTADSTTSTSYLNYVTFKLSPVGTQMWAVGSGITSSGNRSPSKIVYSNYSSSVWVTGEAYITATQPKCAYTVMYNSATGLIANTDIKSCDSMETATTMTVDQWGNAYVGAYRKCNSTYMLQTHQYRLSVNACTPIGIQQGSTNIPGNFVLEQNYPNPFNPTTKIKFDITGTSAQTFLSVYNVLGSKVAVLINESLKPGYYEIEWDASNYPSGVYFYELKTDNFTDSRKMLLIK